MTPTLKQIEDTARAAYESSRQDGIRRAYLASKDHIAMMSPQRTLELVADLRAAAEALEDVRIAAFEHGNKGLSGKTLDPTGGITGAVLAALQNLKRWGI